MNPNPTLDVLQAANRRSQNDTRVALADIGWTRAEAMELVEDVDYLRGVKSAWLNGDEIVVTFSHKTNAQQALYSKFDGHGPTEFHSEVQYDPPRSREWATIDLSRVERED